MVGPGRRLTTLPNADPRLLQQHSCDGVLRPVSVQRGNDLGEALGSDSPYLERTLDQGLLRRDGGHADGAGWFSHAPGL